MMLRQVKKRAQIHTANSWYWITEPLTLEVFDPYSKLSFLSALDSLLSFQLKTTFNRPPSLSVQNLIINKVSQCMYSVFHEWTI